MNETIQFSRVKLADFLACRRRFQLRYLERLPWPVAPLDEPVEQARSLGERFHQLLHRHFLGLPVAGEAAAEPALRAWWERFVDQGPQLPPGRLFPESSLTMPIGRHLLTGRFDLLVLGEAGAHIFDWKTESRPRPLAELEQDLQTRLYLALLAEGGVALGQAIAPEQISLTYWYVHAPEAAATIGYSPAAHQENWTALQELVAQIDRQLEVLEPWPLTNDLAECARCAYQVYCGREAAGQDWNAWELDETSLELEPEIP
ncbi:MAG: PD-(D/E)XK nuclease family protein [Chloroflexi bacterium]|nr:PD-(D/E)XK nuclease family protein [Chloroflexota bacterium]MCI0578315.1 PD-(D/E)XK nuclease family protein [Chloroflexota bacterium]MCI0649017.1 PD-(D/E)XK nuclease family protein [Chloroflexota bacterium]MCI0729452.1 PD-(D/E)XK nuclease family protein [Chloroflexota bacterium]